LSDPHHVAVTFCRPILAVLAALTASISLAGPVRLATSFFLPTGRTNPVILDARADASGNLVTAAQADFGGGKQIVITKFNSAGVRRWSSTINTPVAVTSPGQVAGKFQIMLDGVGNTYVLSPRAGNPDYAATTEDLLVRKLNDAGATVGYLSLVRFLADMTGEAFNVREGQMLPTRKNSTDLGIAVSVRETWNSGVYVLYLDGNVFGGSLVVRGSTALEQSNGWDGISTIVSNYSVVGLTAAGTVADPQLRLIMKEEYNVYPEDDSPYGGAKVLTYKANLEPEDVRINYLDETTIDLGYGYKAEGLGFSESQNFVITRGTSDGCYIARTESYTSRKVLSNLSSLPYTATRVGENWLVYGYRTAGAGEFS